MDEELNNLAERLLKHRIEKGMDPSWPQEVKDKFVETEGKVTRFMADLIIKGKRMAAKEERFRNALGMRLTAPKKRPGS